MITHTSNANSVIIALQGGYNKCFLETDILPKAKNECAVYNKDAKYLGQRRIHNQLVYVDFQCIKMNDFNQNNIENKSKKHKNDIKIEIPIGGAL